MVSMLDVRRLVEERPGITLRDLAWHFRVSENLMAGLVSHLVDRGDLAKVPLLPTCSGCSSGCASDGRPVIAGSTPLKAAQQKPPADARRRRRRSRNKKLQVYS